MVFGFLRKKKGEAVVLEPLRAERAEILDAMRSLDLDLVAVTSAEAALAQIRKSLPNLVLMDLCAEDLDPFRMIARLKNNAVTRNVPLVVCSRKSDNDTVLRLISEGINHFVAIPFDSETFASRVSMALGGPKSPDFRRFYHEISYQESVAMTGYGKLSYADQETVRIESNFKLSSGDQLTLSGALFEEIGCDYVACQVRKTFTDDLYYSFREAAILEPQLKPEEKKCLIEWLDFYKDRSVPKKTKLLFIEPRREIVEKVSDELDLTAVSIRVVHSVQEAIEQAAFIRPRLICFDPVTLEDTALLNRLASGYFAQNPSSQCLGYSSEIPNPDPLQSFSPDRAISLYHANLKEMLPSAIRFRLPEQKPHTDPKRIYFSKTDPCSDIRIHLRGQVTKIGEEGIELKLPNTLYVGTNLQISLKVLTEAGLRNPFIRVMDGKTEKTKEKTAWACRAYFLAINEVQTKFIRRFVYDQELAVKRAEFERQKPK